MKRATILAVGIVLVSNAFALVHAWRNRSGPVDADITLTDRELPLSYVAVSDDSGVALNASWKDPRWMLYAWRPRHWIDQAALRELGFDTTLAPSDPSAVDAYRRQRPRRAFVALEYDGPAWRNWLGDLEQDATEHSERSSISDGQRQSASRLMAVDVGKDAAQLRARHPDRTSVIIVPALIRIAAEPAELANASAPARPALLSGSVEDILTSIHVPLPFSAVLRPLRSANYSVHLRYGASHEPWVVSVQARKPAAP